MKETLLCTKAAFKLIWRGKNAKGTCHPSMMGMLQSCKWGGMTQVSSLSNACAMDYSC
jgi:hypothetical protein